ncbi:pseudouridine synthase [Ideonella sp. 4Y11]|uniref:Pseudouridine synthase n=1 Tax=Ideonella aquatica TaxID=2824119 RepID=A0A941BSD3_9BURK|nr:pseudouridine synthase [Ideonella aquatica]MBQ0961530.1 pseudouridine synthase [Ideonella aquatica]
MSRPAPAWKPPPRQGVGASAVALPHGDWPTVLAFLAWRLPKASTAEWAERLAAGEVFDETGQPVPPDAAYRPGTRLWYWRTPPAEQPVPFQAEILFQDAHLLVVDKPHFLAMTPKGRHARETLLARLQHQLGRDTLVPIHRLDRETAGVVVFSLRPQDRGAYQALFRERAVAKVYEALAPDRPHLAFPLTRHTRLAPCPEQFMVVREVPGEPNALTRIERIERLGDLARYRLHPQTGQTHQLRVHLNALGLPIVGDRIYPVLQPAPAAGEAEDFSAPLQLLARRIAFTDPVTGQAREFESRRRLALLSGIHAMSSISNWS